MGRAGPGFIQVLGEVLIEEGEGFGEGDQYAREAGETRLGVGKAPAITPRYSA